MSRFASSSLWRLISSAWPEAPAIYRKRNTIIKRTVQYTVHATIAQAADPPSPLREGRQVEIIWTRKLPPSSPLGYASDSAKPYQILDMQRSCVDVNSPYKRKRWRGPLVNSILWGPLAFTRRIKGTGSGYSVYLTLSARRQKHLQGLGWHWFFARFKIHHILIWGRRVTLWFNLCLYS